MAVVTNGVGVNLWIQPLPFRLADGGGQYLVATAATAVFTRQDVHQAQAFLVGFEQVTRGRRLAGLQHIRILLGISIQTQVLDAKIDVHQIAGLNDGGIRALGKTAVLFIALGICPLYITSGVKPGFQTQRTHFFPVKPHHVVGSGDARLNHGFGKSFSNDVVGDAANLLIHRKFCGSAHFQPIHRQSFSRHQALFVFGGQGFAQFLIVESRQTIGMPKVDAGIDSDPLGIAFRNKFGQTFPLIGFFFWIPGFFKNLTYIVPGTGQKLEGFVFSRIVNQQHSSASGRQPGGGQHGAQHRIFIVFPRNNQPHVNAFLAHQFRQ